MAENNLSESLESLRGLLDELKESYKYMTVELLGKRLNYINKQIQDSLMNYFLQNHIGAVLRKKMVGVVFLKNLTNQVKKDLGTENKPLYMRLLTAYVSKIEELGLLEEYQAMLWDHVLKESVAPFGSDDWMTHVRIRTVSLLLLVHLGFEDHAVHTYSIHELWKYLFPGDPLPHKEQTKRNYNPSQNFGNVGGGEEVSEPRGKKQKKESGFQESEENVYEGESNRVAEGDVFLEENESAIDSAESEQIEKSHCVNVSIANLQSLQNFGQYAVQNVPNFQNLQNLQNLQNKSSKNFQEGAVGGGTFKPPQNTKGLGVSGRQISQPKKEEAWQEENKFLENQGIKYFESQGFQVDAPIHLNSGSISYVLIPYSQLVGNSSANLQQLTKSQQKILSNSSIGNDQWIMQQLQSAGIENGIIVKPEALSQILGISDQGTANKGHKKINSSNLISQNLAFHKNNSAGGVNVGGGVGGGIPDPRNASILLQVAKNKNEQPHYEIVNLFSGSGLANLKSQVLTQSQIHRQEKQDKHEKQEKQEKQDKLAFQLISSKNSLKAQPNYSSTNQNTQNTQNQQKTQNNTNNYNYEYQSAGLNNSRVNLSYNLEDEMDFQCAEEIPINETRIIGLPLGGGGGGGVDGGGGAALQENLRKNGQNNQSQNIQNTYANQNIQGMNQNGLNVGLQSQTLHNIDPETGLQILPCILSMQGIKHVHSCQTVTESQRSNHCICGGHSSYQMSTNFKAFNNMGSILDPNNDPANLSTNFNNARLLSKSQPWQQQQQQLQQANPTFQQQFYSQNLLQQQQYLQQQQQQQIQRQQSQAMILAPSQQFYHPQQQQLYYSHPLPVIIPLNNASTQFQSQNNSNAHHLPQSTNFQLNLQNNNNNSQTQYNQNQNFTNNKSMQINSTPRNQNNNNSLPLQQNFHTPIQQNNPFPNNNVNNTSVTDIQNTSFSSQAVINPQINQQHSQLLLNNHQQINSNNQQNNNNTNQNQTLIQPEQNTFTPPQNVQNNTNNFINSQNNNNAQNYSNGSTHAPNNFSNLENNFSNSKQQTQINSNPNSNLNTGNFSLQSPSNFMTIPHIQMAELLKSQNNPFFELGINNSQNFRQQPNFSINASHNNHNIFEKELSYQENFLRQQQILNRNFEEDK